MNRMNFICLVAVFAAYGCVFDSSYGYVFDSSYGYVFDSFPADTDSANNIDCEDGFHGDVTLSDDEDSSFKEFEQSNCSWVRGNVFVNNYSGEKLPEAILQIEKIDLNLQITNSHNLQNVSFEKLTYSNILYIANNESLKIINLNSMVNSMSYVINSNNSLTFFFSGAEEVGFITIHNNQNLKSFAVPNLYSLNYVELCNNPKLYSNYIYALVEKANGNYDYC